MFPLVTNTSAVSLVKIIITENKCKSHSTLRGIESCSVLGHSTWSCQYQFLHYLPHLASRADFFKSPSWWFLGKKILTTLFQNCHCCWSFLSLLLMFQFNITTFNLTEQICLGYKAPFSRNEARNKTSLFIVLGLQIVTVSLQHFSFLYTLCTSLTHPYLYTAPWTKFL